MSSKEEVGVGQPIKCLRELWRSGLAHTPIHRAIVLVLAAVPEPAHHPRSIGVEGQELVPARQQKDSLGARLADPVKLPQRLECIAKLTISGAVQIPAKLVDHQSRRVLHVSHTVVDANASAHRGDLAKRGGTRGEDRLWSQPNSRAQRLERG